MKLAFKLPKADPLKEAKVLEDGYTRLKEPKSLGIALIMSIPFALLGLWLSYVVFNLSSNMTLADLGFIPDDSITFTIDLRIVLLMILLLIVHEILHFIFFPNLKSRQNILGITLFGGFAYTEEIISKRRFLVISLAPYILISILLPLILGMFEIHNKQLILMIFLNALASCVDLLNVLIVGFQVPKKSILVNYGMKTYYKKL